MKTMHRSCHHQNVFVATHALGHNITQESKKKGKIVNNNQNSLCCEWCVLERTGPNYYRIHF